MRILSALGPHRTTSRWSSAGTRVTGVPAPPSRQLAPEPSQADPVTRVLDAPAWQGKEKEAAMTWIIILLLILGTVAAVGLRIEAVTRRDRRTELSLAQQWRAMGGG
jgi:hypothetical protein